MARIIILVTVLTTGVFMVGCGMVSNQTINDKAVVINGQLQVEGSSLKDSTNQTIKLKGFCLTNGVYTSPTAPPNAPYLLSDTDYENIKLMGANVVRFYLQYSWLDNSNMAAFFTYMDNQLALMAAADLKAIISLHYFGVNSSGSFYTGTQATKAELKTFWKKISDRYVTNNVIAGYDLLNEPYCSNTFTETELYNIYESIITASIRSNNDEHVVFISDPVNKYDSPTSSYYNLVGADAFKKLSDSNIVYQFHWYKPIKFTHQTVYNNSYFQLGADYPYLKVEEENYKGGWYENTNKVNTSTGWITLTSDPILVDEFINSTPSIDITDRIGLSIILANTKGIIRIKNIRVQKSSSQSFNSFTEIPIKNHDFSMKRRYDIYNTTYDDRPANWYMLTGNSKEKTATESHLYKIVGDHLEIDSTGASWADKDWATLKSNWWDGHTNYIDYSYGEGYYYRVIFDINTNISDGEIFAAFEFYDCPSDKVQLINKPFIQEQITNYYVSWANANNVPLYCGEWGVADPSQGIGMINAFPNAPNHQINWINDMADILSNKSIHWTYHDYKNYDNLGFGVFDTNSKNGIKQALQNAF
jgi:endoglucanase